MMPLKVASALPHLPRVKKRKEMQTKDVVIACHCPGKSAYLQLKDMKDLLVILDCRGLSDYYEYMT